LALEPAGEDGHIVETSTPNTLRFPFFLRDLSLAEQITSAETLLERVLANLSLGEDLLTDPPRITRRGGYRLRSAGPRGARELERRNVPRSSR
jgi:hypothetical protein